MRDSVQILSTRVRPIAADEAARLACQWATEPVARAVCAGNVHMLMEAHDDPGFASIVAAADLVVWDGRPLVWAARLQGVRDAQQCRGPDILLVSPGCPRQERWMVARRDQLHRVMLGVGAAFDMIAGRVAAAPRWIQRAGLEWVFRLAHEPGRLWPRYARHNGGFVALIILQGLHVAVRRMLSSGD